MVEKNQDIIITAASESYRSQLLSFLGSLRCNWPDHPQVRVYDMGLSEGTPELLNKAGFDVRKIPPFVPHWRKHYTWKLWCMADASESSDRVLWMDAGCCILRPLPEIFDIVRHHGYFALPNYRPLEIEASEQACEGCAVTTEFPVGKVSLTAAVFGFLRGSVAERVVHLSLEVAKTERHIMATNPWHRHDQAILSLLMYREISPLVLCDGTIYFYEELAANITTHSVWAARRSMHYKDKKFLASCLFGPVAQFRPRASHKIALWYKIARQPKVLFVTIKRLISRQGRPLDGIK
jgi:hypothetical protein